MRITISHFLPLISTSTTGKISLLILSLSASYFLMNSLSMISVFVTATPTAKYAKKDSLDVVLHSGQNNGSPNHRLFAGCQAMLGLWPSTHQNVQKCHHACFQTQESIHREESDRSDVFEVHLSLTRQSAHETKTDSLKLCPARLHEFLYLLQGPF